MKYVGNDLMERKMRHNYVVTLNINAHVDKVLHAKH